MLLLTDRKITHTHNSTCYVNAQFKKSFLTFLVFLYENQKYVGFFIILRNIGQIQNNTTIKALILFLNQRWI